MRSVPYFLVIIILIFIGAPDAFGQSFSVKGTLVDADSKEPLSFVQVALYTRQDQTRPVTFSDSDENGRFSLQAPKGKYSFKAFFIGYKDFLVNEIEINGPIDLGEISLEDESQNLQEVIVETSKMPIRTSMEGIIISPENNLANVGGTLLDILRNTPSITVSEDGTISLRGSTGTNILINGRNSSLTQNLDNLPASAVEEIRIINNPNARYDAEAEGGVIDIILKKGQDLGTNGGLEATYGTRNRTNLGGRMNHRNARFNSFVGYNYRDWKSIGNRETTRILFEDQETLRQSTENTNRNVGHNLNYGADYYFGNNVLSYEGVFQSSLDRQVNTLFAELERPQGEIDAFDYVRRNQESETDVGLDNALIFEHSFEDKGHLLRATASHSFRNQFKTQEIDIFNNTLEPLPENRTGQELAYIDEIRNISIMQVDYIKPYESAKFETGLKSIIRKFDNDYQYFRFDETEGGFLEDERVSNRFIYQDQIHAGYALISVSKPKFEYGIGLRGEYTIVDTDLQNTGEQNRQNYFNLFPSAQGMYNINEVHAIKATYSRRIDRPTAWRLNPFPDITDSLNVRRGNPNLQPELINSFELGHMINLKKANFITNLFYRKVNGQLDFITIVEDGISYSQPENLLSAESYGVELIGTGEVNDWYSVNGGLTLFSISVDGSNISEEFTNSGFAWNVKLTQDFKLPYGINFQVAGNYESPEIEAQGRDLAQYFVDATIQRNFFNKKGSLALSVRDIFDTRRFAGFARTNSFSQDFYSKQETRIVLLSARYNF
ncbi:outer membrane beta-barrel family protein [Pararhodonellum marinum]|uniref:outer membrane beta-barrel family protein n=1 Tax=Pararhodonellum marinum TaxID=2755358 RepID=UPI00188DFC90|nr:outer membrane beta-barrel family protein [Pararhodonellum marinum]